MSSVPTLTDGDVVIRALGEQDIPGCYEQCIDPLSVEWTQVPRPFTPEMARDFCLRIAPEAWADGSQWIFCVEADGRYAGNIALRDEGHGRAEIAYGAHPDVRGTGVMERGLRLLLEWGFDTQGVRTTIWLANVGNWASRKLAWRLGFTLDGILRQSHVSHDALVDAWVGTLLADEPRQPHGRWLGTPVLEGGTVRLRPFGEGDVARVVEACGDERTQHWLGRMPAPYTEADARTWYAATAEKRATGGGTTWAVVDPATDVALASIGIFDLDETDCEIGYWTHPDARGRGVMRAALPLVTSWAFAELGVRRVRVVAAVDNAASRHVIESSGFRQTGEERFGTTTRDGLADVALYDVLADEWESLVR